MRYGISEIINKAAAAKSKDEKVKILRENNSIPLLTVLQTALDPRYVWSLPEGPVPYTPSAHPDGYGTLYQEAKRFYLFIEGMHPTLKQTRREQLFIGLLESLEPKDAELLVMIKDKKLPKGLDAKIINEAFPGLIQGKEEKKDNEKVT